MSGGVVISQLLEWLRWHFTEGELLMMTILHVRWRSDLPAVGMAALALHGGGVINNDNSPCQVA